MKYNSLSDQFDFLYLAPQIVYNVKFWTLTHIHQQIYLVVRPFILLVQCLGRIQWARAEDQRSDSVENLISWRLLSSSFLFRTSGNIIVKVARLSSCTLDKRKATINESLIMTEFPLNSHCCKCRNENRTTSYSTIISKCWSFFLPKLTLTLTQRGF